MLAYPAVTDGSYPEPAAAAHSDLPSSHNEVATTATNPGLCCTLLPLELLTPRTVSAAALAAVAAAVTWPN